MNTFQSRTTLTAGSRSFTYFSLPAIGAQGFNLARLPWPDRLRMVVRALARRLQ